MYAETANNRSGSGQGYQPGIGGKAPAPSNEKMSTASFRTNIEQVAAALGNAKVTFYETMDFAELTAEDGDTIARIMCIEDSHGGHLTIVCTQGDTVNSELMRLLKLAGLPQAHHGKIMVPPDAT